MGGGVDKHLFGPQKNKIPQKLEIPKVSIS